MAGSGNKWVWGCGIGCAGLLLLGVLAVVGVVTVTRSSLHRFRAAESWRDSLAATVGSPRDWVPPADGVPAEGRLELFLAVRDSVLPAERVFAERLRSIHEATRGRKSPLTVWRALKGGLSSVGEIGTLVEARNRALYRVRMNPAEFAWWSILVYHDWLGRPLLPPDLFDRKRVKTGTQQEALLRLLRSRFQAMADTAMAGGDVDWIEELSAEQKRLLRDPDRLPWEDGLPRRLVTALAPWRSRLEAAGDPLACFTAMVDVSTGRRGSVDVQVQEKEAGQEEPAVSGGE